MDLARLQCMPSLAFDRIAEECDDRSLFHLALSLSDTKAFFRNFHIKKRPIEFMSMDLRGPFPRLHVSLEKNKILRMHFCRLNLAEGSDKFQIGETVARCCQTVFNTNYIFSDSFMALCRRVANLLFHIFAPIKFSCTLPAQINVPLFMKALNLSHSEEFSFHSTYALREQDFMLVWNTARPSKFLFFETQNIVIQQPKRDLLANYPELWIICGRWVTDDMFQATNSRIMKLHDTNLNNNSVNHYIKSWMNGMKKNLEDMSIGMENPSIDEILVGLDSKSTEEIKKERNWEDKTLVFAERGRDFKVIDAKNARHIAGKDGGMATIGITSVGRVHFLVWSAKVPIVRDKDPFHDYE